MSERARWIGVVLAAVAAAAIVFALARRPHEARAARDATSRATAAPAVLECPKGSVLFDGGCVSPAACPPGRVALSGVCVRLAAPEVGPYAPPVLVSNEHTEHDGTRTRYDIVPLAPDRPEAYESYVYPVPPADPVVTSGFDLHLPDRRQRRGNPKNPVGHGGLDLTRRIGVPVTSVPFEAQVGPTRVVFTGMLFGRTVATLHERTDGRYVALHGHLSEIAPGVAPGATVEPGALLGAVGDSWTPGVPHLHYEVRYIRPGVDPWTLEGTELWDNTRSVPCDPRNVLPRLR